MTKKLFSLFSTMMISAAAFAQTAQLQVIHNSADPATAVVDVYINGALTLDDVAFRTATTYLTVPAGVPLNVGVALGNSMSVNDTVRNFSVTLASGETYLAMATGVINPSNFAVNPDGTSTAFTLLLQNQMRTQAAMMGDVDFRIVHGASDAPTVDVIARGTATLANDASYTAITGYINVSPSIYTLDVTSADGSTVVNSYYADLSGLAGGSAVVFASGFLTPSNNQNGPAFGIFAALANGTIVEFLPFAKLQIIHNAADPAADTVDVYLDGDILLNDFAFRTATGFVDVPPNMNHNIGIAAGNSTSVNDTLKNFTVNLMPNVNYLAVANGVLNPANFAANPDAVATDFTLFLQANMRREALNSNEVDFRIVHGASDAPTVDVVARGVATLADDATYGAITPYINVPNANYTIDIKDATGTVTVASFIADLSSLAGSSAVVFASGFLTPASNQNGPAFGVLAALVNGTVVNFPAEVTSVTTINNNLEFAIFPSPAKNEAFLRLNTADFVDHIEIADLTGKLLEVINVAANTELVQLPIQNLAAGVYFVKVVNNEGFKTMKFIRE